MLIRCDDTPWGLSLQEFVTFCNICDKHGFKLLQAITPIGDCYAIDSHWDNDRIKKEAGNKVVPREFVEYMRSRNDLIAVHGLWHSHLPTREEIEVAKSILDGWGLHPTHYVAPFNELNAVAYDCNLTVVPKVERLEDYLPGMSMKNDTPVGEIAYLHIWRFFRGWYSIDALDKTLERLANATR